MPVLSLPYRWALSKTSDWYLPTVTKRVEEYKSSESRNHPPNDMLQWTIERSVRKYGESASSPRDVANTLIFLNIFGECSQSEACLRGLIANPAAITIDIVLDTVLKDVLSHPPDTMLLQQLRREADEALPGVRADPLRALAEMLKLDSSIRETLRIHPSNDHGMMRQIVKPEGVTTPNGLYLPEGTYVGSHVAAMQRYTTVCHDADQYRPLRFYEERKEMTESSVTAAHISDKFLPFALGRHAWYV